MLYKKVLKEIPAKQLDKVKTPRKSDRYLGVAQVVKDKKCGEILVVDIYQKGNVNVRDVKFRFFSDGITYQFYNVTKDEWSKNSYPVAIGGNDYDHYFYTPDDLKMYASAESMEIMKKFFRQKYGDRGDSVISYFISEKRFDERMKAKDRKKELLKSRMDMFPEYPKGLDKFLRNKVFGNYLIVGKKCGDTREFECTACNRKGKIRGDVLHKSFTECPKCGQSVTAWKKQYVESIRRKAKVCIASRVDDQLLLRWTEVSENWCKNEKGKFVPSYLKEDYFRTMHLVVKGKPSIHHFNNLNMYGYGKEWRETKWQKDDSVYVYDGNLREVFGDKYYNVDLQFELGKLTTQICFISLLNNLKNLKPTEYLLKMGMVKLAYEINFNTVKNGRDFGSILGVNPQYKAMYRKFNVSLCEHRIVEAANEYISEDDFIKMRTLGISSYSLENVRTLLSAMSYRRFVNYFTKQKQNHPKEEIGHLMTWYIDYIRMSEQMGVDLSHKSVRFPKDIKAAHDDLITKFKSKEMEIYDGQMRKATENLYNGLTEYKSDGYAIVFPRTRTEFVMEGQSLNHCVGTQEMYFKNHLEGTRMIFFIRHEEEIEKPFVTMEVDMRELRIRQIYGYGDKAPAKEVRDFADKFLSLLKKDVVRRSA